MLAPGWGEQSIPVRFRLSAALLAVFALAPGLMSDLPLQPADFGQGIFLVIGEVLIGLMLGAAARMFMAAASVAGQVTAMHTGLGFAMQLDPMQQAQGNVLSAFFSLIAVVLVLSAGVHRWMLQGAVDSYILFPVGQYPNMADVAEYGTRAFVEARVKVGNFYVNRNQIGAVVESQPFGGEGLSGTGPKAGGPHYVQRFATERVVCVDTTAAGGNATLLAS